MRVEYVQKSSRQVPVIFIQPARKELCLMYNEDVLSTSIRSSEKASAFYIKGESNLMRNISKDLSNLLGQSIPYENYPEFIRKLQLAITSKANSQMTHFIECDLSDLYNLRADVQRFISLAEQGPYQEQKLKIRNLKLKLKLIKNEYIEAGKKELSEAFKDLYDLDIDHEVSLYILALKQEIKELRDKEFDKEFECDLTKEMNETWENMEIEPCSFSMSTEEMISSKFQKHQKKIIRDKEWEKLEVQKLKEKYRSKKKRLNLRHQELLELEKYLKKKNLDIEKEKSELERLKDAYYREKKRIAANIEVKAKKLSEAISEITQSIDLSETIGKISPITETDMLSDISYLSDSDTSFDNSTTQELDINVLQKKILELETVCKSETSIESQEKIRKEIENLRNSCSLLRSSNVIKSSVTNQKRFSFLKNCRNSLGDQSIGSKKPLSLALPLNSPKPRLANSAVTDFNRPRTITSSTPKAASTHFNFNDIAPRDINEEDSQLRKFLRAQEVKLKEREERVERDREKWMQNWNKVPNANELIPLIQREMLECKKKKEEIDRKGKDFEQKELDFHLKFERLKKQEREIEMKAKELADMKEKIEEEKVQVVQRLGKLKEDLEDKTR